jgi:hypothetical protein
MAGNTATCAGAPDCNIKGGRLGVSPGTNLTGNFDITGVPSYSYSQSDCADDGWSAWADGSSRNGGITMHAEMGGLTFTPGFYSYGEGINIASNNPKVVLDAEGDEDAVFIFHAGTTLTTCAGSQIVLQGGAKVENVFWVLGTALTMGGDSILVGIVLAGSAITIGTNGEIVGRAIAQSGVTCETACTVDSRRLNSAQPSSEPSSMPSSTPSDAPSTMPSLQPPTRPSDELGQFVMTVNTDWFPEETSWELVDECDNGKIVMKGGPYRWPSSWTTFIEESEVRRSQYTLNVYDSYGDGLCLGYMNLGDGSFDGSFSATLDGLVVGSGACFNYSYSSTFGSCTDPSANDINV